MGAMDFIIGHAAGESAGNDRAKKAEMEADHQSNVADREHSVVMMLAAQRNMFRRKFEVERVSRKEWQKLALERSKLIQDLGVARDDLNGIAEKAAEPIRERINSMIAKEDERIETVAQNG